MEKRDYNHNTNYFKKLPNIALIPWHHNNENTPPYPFFGKREIFCGPKLQNEETNGRKYIRTNRLVFDICEVLSQLNKEDQEIDFVYSFLEVGVTCFPVNLSKLKCIKCALVADTHHLKYSISSIIHYLKREKIGYLFIVAQPAHLHFFYEAGIKNSAFLPRAPVNFEKIDNKKSGVTYIGKTWKSSHPRRSRMVQFLEKKLPRNKIPFNRYNRLSKENWRKALSASKMTAISSLNGQFTPQIHGCLSAGTLCFVDELSSQTFLYQFFESGKHLITWRNFKDLLEKIIYYYNHPDEAEAIAKAGKLQAEKIFAPVKGMISTIQEFVYENKIDPRFLAINDKRCLDKRVESPEYFNARVRLYENIQELHRIHESLTLISLTEKNLKPIADLADLPRLRITHGFVSNDLKNQADIYFHSIGVNHQIKTSLLNKIQKFSNYDIGLLETKTNQNWEYIVKSLSKLLKLNSILWILGELTPFEESILAREGFKNYYVKNDKLASKIKNLSRKLCFLSWKLGLYPFPYLTLKPAMETVPNLSVFIRGWQAYFPFLF